ncbi:MAG TPA: DUF4259 domain-containing protein [Longimicrobium sp.]|nr:DUF4259 domain-containing protein [Longimicrobium sp.]
MGAWGTGVFENDTALDWFDALERRGTDAVLAALQTIPEEDDSIEADQAAEALAAAEIVAAALGHPAAGLPGEGADWVQAHAGEIDSALVPLAVDAVTRIRANSETQALWEESDSGAEWHAVVDDLLARLGRVSGG